MYILLAGLPGTGKTSLAAELAKLLPASVVLNKDDVRAVLFPGAAIDYSDAQNDLSMAAMLSSATYLCKQTAAPRFILFDGRTFSRASQIDPVIEAAEANGAAWRILHLWCPDEIAIARIAASSKHHPAKDRDPALYTSLKQRFEPIPQPHLSIDTARPLQLCVEESLAYLSS